MNSDILVLVLVVAFWVISTVIGISKKKGVGGQEPLPEADEDDPYDDRTLGRFGKARDFREKEEPEEPKPFTYDDFRRPEYSYDDLIVDEESARAAAKSSSKEEVDKKSNIKASASTPERGVLEDFNLRDAIIYSELLKPKYKED